MPDTELDKFIDKIRCHIPNLDDTKKEKIRDLYTCVSKSVSTTIITAPIVSTLLCITQSTPLEALLASTAFMLSTVVCDKRKLDSNISTKATNIIMHPIILRGVISFADRIERSGILNYLAMA